MHLTLLIPELLWPEPDDADTLTDLPCPALSALLGRSRFRRQAGGTFDQAIAACFGLVHNAPYAALRLLGEGIDPGTMSWACADPVHLRFHQERLVLADGSALDIATAEAEALVGELNRVFADVGEFRSAAPDRWYLRLTEDVHFEVPPLSAMAGRRIDRQLPEETGTAWLRKLLNEAQMVLHGHPANEARTDSGRLSINSLWLWGPGRLPTSGARHFDAVFSQQPLARGLGRHEASQVLDIPADFAALASHAAAQGGARVLVILDDLLGPVQYEDGRAWRGELEAIERHWFAPLLAAIRSGRVTLTLCASTIYGQLEWQAGAGDLWKLWRRAQTPAAIAGRLAAETEAKDANA